MYQALGLISASLIFFIAIPYYRSIFRGRSKPQRMAMFIFLVISAISFSSQWAEGATTSLYFAGMLLFNQIGIFSLSIKYGVGGYQKIDIISLLFAVLILVIWYITRSASIALILVTGVNFIGKVLVAQKAYRHPQTELLYSWALSVIAATMAAISVGELDWILILPPAHNAITLGAIVFILYHRGNKSFSPFH